MSRVICMIESYLFVYRWAVSWMNAVMRLEDSLKFIDCPLLLLHGSADHISDVNSSREVFDKVRSSDKNIKVNFILASHKIPYIFSQSGKKYLYICGPKRVILCQQFGNSYSTIPKTLKRH